MPPAPPAVSAPAPPAAPGRSATPARLAVFVGLLALLLAPLLAWTFGWEGPPVEELRALRSWPHWQQLAVPRWPAAFEAWLNDHVPLRRLALVGRNLIRHRWLGAPSRRVTVGQDGWLFYRGNRIPEDRRGRDRLSPAELEHWRLALESRQRWLAARGVAHLVVLVPNKSTIYPEKLPPFVQSRLRPGKFDQIVGHLRTAASPLHLLDLRPVLAAAKRQHRVYWVTDSHWNGYGLLAASEAIAAQLARQRVPLFTGDLSPWLHLEEADRDGDCVRLLALADRWPTPRRVQLHLHPPPEFRRVTTPLAHHPAWRRVDLGNPPLAFEHDRGHGRAVMLCDSFFRVGGLADANAESPLVLRFRRFVSLWSWNDETNLARPDLLEAILELEHPDVIIEQWTERYLRTPAPAIEAQ